MGVLGNVAPGLGSTKWPMMSKISGLLGTSFVAAAAAADPKNSMSSSSSEAVFLWVGFRVSKQMIPSKQSSNPSLLRALAAWTLSAFVKIYFNKAR